MMSSQKDTFCSWRCKYYIYRFTIYNIYNYLNVSSTLRMKNGTLLDLVVRRNKTLTYVEAKPLITELASCVNVSYH